jgi:hypothetical protein
MLRDLLQAAADDRHGTASLVLPQGDFVLPSGGPVLNPKPPSGNGKEDIAGGMPSFLV